MSENMEIRFGDIVKLELGNTIPVPVRDYLLMINKPSINGQELVGNLIIKLGDLENDAGYLTEETDPTVPAWAKQPNKPTYTAQEVGAMPSTVVIPVRLSQLTDDVGYYIKPVGGIPLSDLVPGIIPDFSSKLDTAQKGAPGGVAELDQNGMVPSHQLPSYVDDVKTYSSVSVFPVIGEDDKIYIDKSTNKQYRWSGDAEVGYVPIASSIALGETAQTAYRGDRGKVAYDHAMAKGQAFENGLYKITVNAEGHVVAATQATKEDIVALGIPGSQPDVSGFYTKPVNGIPATDLAAGVIPDVSGFYTKPSGGIPATDLAEGVIPDVSDKVDKISLDNAGISAITYTEKFNGAFTVTTAVDQTHISPYARASVTGTVNKENLHKITVNNIEYILPARVWFTETELDVVIYEYIGNIGLLVSDTSGIPWGVDNVPFLIVFNNGNDSTIDVLTSTAGSNTILIEQINTTKKVLPKELLYGDNYYPIYNNNGTKTINSLSIGVNNVKEKEGTYAIGIGNTIEGKNSIAIGVKNKISGKMSMGIGRDNTVSGNYSVGAGNETIVSGNSAHAEGETTTASGRASHAEGQTSNSAGDFSHAEGQNTRASLDAAHSEGINTVASGAYSHAEGNGTTASNTNAHAEGNGTTANSANGHAEGNGSIASGNAAHAEGQLTNAAGAASHAEGNSNTTSGKYAHAEGTSNTASANSAHAEGAGTVASGSQSHAEGLMTIANHKAQHVHGAYNVADPSQASFSNNGTYVEIVGNGADANHRSNAYALDWNGNGRFNGDLYVECDDDSSNGKKVATIDDISPIVNVNGSTPSITGIAGTTYICGEVSMLTIIVPESGCIDVIFKSGSIPTVLTITPPSGTTIKWMNNFDPANLEADATYEINIMNGYGVVGIWT